MVVHEANARPGLANRVGARLGATVATAGASRLKGAIQVGMPLRRSISDFDRVAQRPAALQRWGFEPDGPVLLVTGGSQGARRINTALLGALPHLLDRGARILHVTGRANLDAVRSAAAAHAVPLDGGYRSVGYVEDMADAYAAADLVLCRSGMMTVAEVTTVGLPAVFVPLPIGNGEQRLNALPVVGAGGALMIDDANLSTERLIQEIEPLLFDPDRLSVMGNAAATLGRRDADVRLARLILEAVNR